MTFERRPGTITLDQVEANFDTTAPLVYQKEVRVSQTPADLLRTDALIETFRSIRASSRHPSTPLHALVLKGGMTAPQVAAAIIQSTSTVYEELSLLAELGLTTATADDEGDTRFSVARL